MPRPVPTAQALLDAIVEASDDAMLAATSAGEIFMWNRGATSLFGYGADEIVGRSVSALMAPESIENLRHFTAQISSSGKTISQLESVVVCKDGTLLHVLASGGPIKDNAGKVMGISVVIHDISSQTSADQKPE